MIELYGAVIVRSAVLDMLRYDQFGIGHLWTSEYGDPKDKKYFDNLHAYSPYHNIPNTTDSKKQYPATLVMTGSKDDRVPPLHSYKFTAALQHMAKSSKNKQTNPLLLYVHGLGHRVGSTPTDRRIHDFATMYAFIYKALDIKTTL